MGTCQHRSWVNSCGEYKLAADDTPLIPETQTYKKGKGLYWTFLKEPKIKNVTASLCDLGIYAQWTLM